jgi:hypothetical protein
VEGLEEGNDADLVGRGGRGVWEELEGEMRRERKG